MQRVLREAAAGADTAARAERVMVPRVRVGGGRVVGAAGRVVEIAAWVEHERVVPEVLVVVDAGRVEQEDCASGVKWFL